MEYAHVYGDRSGGTAFKAGHALQSVGLKDGLRPIDSFSSLESARIGSTPCCSSAACQWDVDDSRNLYAVNGWGHPYFSVEDSGRLSVKPIGRLMLPC